MTLIVNHHIVPFMEHQMTYCFSQTSRMAENKIMKEIRYPTAIEYIGMLWTIGLANKDLWILCANSQFW